MNHIASDVQILHRMSVARRAKAEKKLVSQAYVEDDKLVMWNCEPTRFEMPISEIPPLLGMSAKSLTALEVVSSGVHWPDGDVDISLDTLLEYNNPTVRHRREVRARREVALYAKAVRRFREERGLKQAGIAGLSERQVRRIEDGDSFPHMDTLVKLAAAHSLSVNEYLGALARRSGRAKARRRVAALKGRGYEVRDQQNRVRAQPRRLETAHRATRTKRFAETVVRKR
jgi:transcriptional regulator with XRE-family HTH domain